MAIMDFITEHAGEYLPQIYELYSTYYVPLSPYLLPVFRSFLYLQSYFYRYLFPTIYPIYRLLNGALQTLSSDSPDLITLGVLAVVFIISIKALDYMRRSLISWISIFIKFGIYGLILLAGIYIWQRGLEQSLQDFGWLWSLWEQYGDEGEQVGGRRARGKAEEARRARQAQMGKRGRTRGAGW